MPLAHCHKLTAPSDSSRNAARSDHGQRAPVHYLPVNSFARALFNSFVRKTTDARSPVRSSQHCSQCLEQSTALAVTWSETLLVVPFVQIQLQRVKETDKKVLGWG